MVVAVVVMTVVDQANHITDPTLPPPTSPPLLYPLTADLTAHPLTTLASFSTSPALRPDGEQVVMVEKLPIWDW